MRRPPRAPKKNSGPKRTSSPRRNSRGAQSSPIRMTRNRRGHTGYWAGLRQCEPLASFQLPLEPTTTVDLEQARVEAVDDAGGVGSHHVHLLNGLTVVVGHLQGGVAEQRLEGERVAVAHEVETGERVAQQMGMETLHPRLPTDPLDELLQRLSLEATAPLGCPLPLPAVCLADHQSGSTTPCFQAEHAGRSVRGADFQIVGRLGHRRHERGAPLPPVVA